MRFFAKSTLILLLTFCLANTYAQTKKPAADSKNKSIVAEFAGEKITSDEFEKAFLQVGIPKMEGKVDSLAEKKKFLELYLNYKMKLKDALDRNLDKEPEVICEYKNYRKSISSSMFIESEIVNKALKQIYEKKKIEFRLSQIFFKFDSTKADLGLSKAQNVLDKINAGEKFEDLVNQFSEDPRAKGNNGDLYYVSLGDINIPEIENAMYATDEGKVIPQIFKTQVGFHILKVNEKRPKVYAISVSHILALYKTPLNEPDTLAAKRKIIDASNELKKGIPFEEVAKKFSDDKNTSPRGGLLGDVSRGQFVREIDELLMAMKEGQVSEIIQTRYGFHILKANKILPVPSFDEQREQLKEFYQKTTLKSDVDRFVNTQKEKLGFKVSTSLYKTLTAVQDSFSVGDSQFNANIKSKYKDVPFITLNGKEFVADSLFNFMVNSADIVSKRYNKNLIDQSINGFTASIIVSETALNRFNNDPEFERIMAEYKNGILLFKVSDMEIWSKLKVDSNQVKDYWEKTKDNYITKPKVVYREIFLTTEKLRDSVFNALKEGADFDQLLKKSLRPNSEVAKTAAPDQDELALKAGKLAKEGDYSEPFSYNGGWSIVRLDKRLEKRIKTFDEAKPEVSSILQEKESKRLEELYVNTLKNKFKPALFMENVKL